MQENICIYTYIYTYMDYLPGVSVCCMFLFLLTGEEEGRELESKVFVSPKKVTGHSPSS